MPSAASCNADVTKRVDLMSKIGLIVSREFNQRVRKKSFILTTILTPLLLVGLMVAPALVMQLRSDQVKRIAVVDRSGIVGDKLQGDRETEGR